AAAAELILAIFDDFYDELCAYPYRAKRAFEARDPQASVRISAERLGLYSRYIAEHGPRIHAAFPALAAGEDIWEALDRRHCSMARRSGAGFRWRSTSWTPGSSATARRSSWADGQCLVAASFRSSWRF